MSRTFRHYLRVSAIWHAVIILLLIVVPLILNWRARRKPRELITFIDLQVALPSPPEVKPVEKIQAPPTPPKPPDKIPTPVPLPPPVKTDIPEPEQPKPKPKVEVSKVRVKREAPPPPKPKTPPLSEEEIKRLLAAGAKISDRTTIPTEVQPSSWYYALVKQTMYDAWIQPGELSAKAGLAATVAITVQKDGTITARRMVAGSGNRVMDDSVMKAVNAVMKLKPLPEQFGAGPKDIVIEFELEQTSIF